MSETCLWNMTFACNSFVVCGTTIQICSNVSFSVLCSYPSDILCSCRSHSPGQIIACCQRPILMHSGGKPWGVVKIQAEQIIYLARHWKEGRKLACSKARLRIKLIVKQVMVTMFAAPGSHDKPSASSTCIAIDKWPFTCISIVKLYSDEIKIMTSRQSPVSSSRLSAQVTSMKIWYCFQSKAVESCRTEFAS